MLIIFSIGLLISVIFCIYAAKVGSNKLMLIGFCIAALVIIVFSARDIIGRILFKQQCEELGGVTAILQLEANRVCINPDSIEYIQVAGSGLDNETD